MLIALDYDGTYTADPVFWDTFIVSARVHGHTVVCITMRHEHEEHGESAAVLEDMEAHGIQVMFTGRLAKRAFAAAKGLHPDVWIDDSPHCICEDADD
jgi:hypothetical protein